MGICIHSHKASASYCQGVWADNLQLKGWNMDYEDEEDEGGVKNKLADYIVPFCSQSLMDSGCMFTSHTFAQTAS